MVKKSIIELAQGSIVWTDEVIGDVVRDWVYKLSNLMATGTKLIKVKGLTGLDAHWEFPSELTADYPVAIGTVVHPQKIEWLKYGLTLEQAQVHVLMLDDAKLRGDSQYQNQITTKRAAEALTKTKDHEILGKIAAGAGATTVTAANKWDVAAGDPEGNIVDAWGNILAESNVTDSDLKKTALLIPAKALPQLMKLQLIGNVQQSMRAYLKETYGIELFATRDSQIVTDAYLLVMGPDTGVHGELHTNKIPLQEKERLYGQGDRWLVRQFFKTKITPESETVSTSYRICKIATIL
jgi:hypothetical protein